MGGKSRQQKAGCQAQAWDSLGQPELGQLEPQKLCRVLNPKGLGKRVKRGNPPRCNLRKGRLRSFPESQGSRAKMDDHLETEPGLLTSKVKRTRRKTSFFVIVVSKVLE